ncbi:MAG: oligosaccharide flippase family protein [Candidatus Paceibacterota bacterium]
MYTKLVSSVKNLLLRPLFKELSWYTLAQVFIQGASFISVIIVSRYLGPTNLGLYSFVINYVGAFLTVISGMDFYFGWKLVRSQHQHEDFKVYLGHKFNIYIVLSLMGLISAWYVLPKDVATFVSIILVTISLQSLNTFSIYAIVNNRAKLVSIVQMLNAGIMLILKVSFVLLKAPLIWFIVISAFDLILAGLIFSTYFLKSSEWRKVFYSFRLPSLISSFIFLYSIRLSIASLIFWQLLLRIDQLILATVSNAYTLGIYSAAVRISDVPNFLAGVLSNALVSRIAYISTKDNDESKSNLKKIMFYYVGIGFFIFFIFLIFAPLAVKILYGSKFIESVPVLRVYSLSIPAMFLISFFINVYGVKDKYHHQVMIFGSSLIVNVVLIYMLTPIYGIVGTASATVIAYTFSALLFYFNLNKK